MVLVLYLSIKSNITSYYCENFTTHPKCYGGALIFKITVHTGIFEFAESKQPEISIKE